MKISRPLNLQGMTEEIATRGNTGFCFLLPIAGFIGNMAVCAAVYKNTNHPRKVTNIMVVALALSDIFMCFFGA